MIVASPTAETAFVDRFARGPAGEAVRCASFADFERVFGGIAENGESALQVRQYFANGGRVARVVGLPSRGDWLAGVQTALPFQLLCLPSTRSAPERLAALELCERRRAFCLIDAAPAADAASVLRWLGENAAVAAGPGRCGAVYYPRLVVDGQEVGASGTVAGIYARIDAARGVWKAPAGVEAVVRGATAARPVSEGENSTLNTRGVNAIRAFAGRGVLLWGARTMGGNDEWKYISVRRLAQFIERSIEASGPVELRDVTAFLTSLWRQGALAGRKPEEAFFARVDGAATRVGIAPLRASEFALLDVGATSRGGTE